VERTPVDIAQKKKKKVKRGIRERGVRVHNSEVAAGGIKKKQKHLVSFQGTLGVGKGTAQGLKGDKSGGNRI